MIGTANKIDLSGYTTLHIVGKAFTRDVYCGVLSTRDVASRVALTEISTVGSKVDYAIDVSTINTSYYIAFWSIASTSAEIYEIYLT